MSGKKAVCNQKKCIGCGACTSVCPNDAVSIDATGKCVVNRELCIGCGACASVCPVSAIKTENKK
jgi:Fe-S-cluster-containing hydrogenase component 2